MRHVDGLKAVWLFSLFFFLLYFWTGVRDNVRNILGLKIEKIFIPIKFLKLIMFDRSIVFACEGRKRGRTGKG